MRIAVGTKTDVGRKRARNEDSHCADPRLGLYVVCDGMGGLDAGDRASRLAVDTIHRCMVEAGRHLEHAGSDGYDPRFSLCTNRLAGAIRQANQASYGASREASQRGMGTTVVAAFIQDQVLSVAHVGDSRLYLIRGGTIQVLTADHSLVAEQVRGGALTAEEAARSPQRNIVTRALGIDEKVEVDLDEIQLMGGDMLLLCSDGLTRGVEPEGLLRAIGKEKDPQAASERLVTLACEAGGEDNITAILVAVQSRGRKGLRRWMGWIRSRVWRG